MIFSQVFINFGPALQGGEWTGGGEGQVGVGRKVAKAPR